MGMQIGAAFFAQKFGTRGSWKEPLHYIYDHGKGIQHSKQFNNPFRIIKRRSQQSSLFLGIYKYL